MTSDRVLTRLIAATACLLALMAVATECLLVIDGRDVPEVFAQLAALIVGAILGRLTTSKGNSGDAAVTTTVTDPGLAQVPEDLGT